MRIPLYKGAPEPRPEGGHAGLWHDKFCNEWRVDGGNCNWSLASAKKGEKNPKKSWIDQVAKSNAGKKELLEEAIERLTCLVEGLNGRSFWFKTDDRFVTGMGRKHPVGNGFTWHPTLGTPYLPGSSLKGALRAWATLSANDKASNVQTDQKETINRIFGPLSKEPRTVGSIIFFDAIPVRPVKLETDIMTPHYAEYYRDGSQPPADWLSPEPIPFLTVASGQEFFFSIAPRRSQNGPDVEQDLKQVEVWLKEALTSTGVGGKTAVGYGRFTLNPKAQEAVEAKRAERRRAKEHTACLTAMSPIEREMAEDGYENRPDRFIQSLTEKWLKRMDGADTAPGHSLEIAEHLAAWYQTHRPGDWNNPKGKNAEKVRRIQSVLQKE